MQPIPTKTAFKNAKRSPISSWDKAGDRLKPEVWPEIQPTFQIAAGGKIFAIGSCFARNIEEHLSRLNYDVPTLEFSVPKEESDAPRANAILNKYTPAAIWQEVDWVARIFGRDGVMVEDDCARFSFHAGNNVVDTNLGGFVPVTPERFLERRRCMYETWEHMFSANCVTFTLGLIEAWYDKENDIYIQQAPAGRAFIRQADRFELHVLSFEDSVQYIQNSIDTIRQFNAGVKILITTSPIPLARTFSGEDVITANMRAKSLLRAVCGDIVSANDDTDYFPSFESVILTKEWGIWSHDKRHVSDAFVSKIVRRLAATYFAEADEASKLFQGAFTEHNNQNSEQAAKLIRQALDMNSDNSDWWLLSARIQRDLANFDDAILSVDEALKRSPDSAEGHYIAATILEKASKDSEALASAEKAVTLDGNKAHYRFFLGQSLQKAGEGDRALEQARIGLSLQPAYWRAHARLSQALEDNGLTEEALASAQEAFRRFGDNPWLHSRIARLFLKLGHLAKAREHVDKAWELKPAKRSFRKKLQTLVADIERRESGPPNE